MKKKILLGIYIVLLLIPLSFALELNNNGNGVGVVLNIPDLPTNYSLIPTVNTSDFWDNDNTFLGAFNREILANRTGGNVNFTYNVSANYLIGNGSFITGIETGDFDADILANRSKTTAFTNIELPATTATTGQITVDGINHWNVYALNTILGYNSGNAGTAGHIKNTGMGFETFKSLTTGDFNSCFGYASCDVISSGSWNAFIGYFAGGLITTGKRNIGMGYGAISTSTGMDNVGIGQYTCGGTGASSNSTCIGSYANTYGSSHGVFLGYGAGYYETEEGKLYIDNKRGSSLADSRANAMFYGEFDDTAENQNLTINANINISENTLVEETLTVNQDIHIGDNLHFDKTTQTLIEARGSIRFDADRFAQGGGSNYQFYIDNSQVFLMQKVGATSHYAFGGDRNETYNVVVHEGLTWLFEDDVRIEKSLEIIENVTADNFIDQDGVLSFGVWNDTDGDGVSDSALVVDTVYQAETDGFVTVKCEADANGDIGYWTGFTDGNNPPVTARLGTTIYWDYAPRLNSFTMPVRKGDYWKITEHQNVGAIAVVIQWLPTRV